MSDEYLITDLANWYYWYYEDKTHAPIQGGCSKSKHIFYGVVFCDLIFIIAGVVVSTLLLI